MNRLLIAGIDPGTVGAFALLDTEGNLVYLSSGRNYNSNKIMFEITKHGKIFLVGCDVEKCPESVSRIARKIGAKVSKPDHDLRYFEKIKIVDKFLKTKKERIKICNKHEKDALASALYGLKSVNGLIKKIKDHLEEHDKVHLFNDVKHKVLVENIPITKALKLFS